MNIFSAISSILQKSALSLQYELPQNRYSLRNDRMQTQQIQGVADSILATSLEVSPRPKQQFEFAVIGSENPSLEISHKQFFESIKARSKEVSSSRRNRVSIDEIPLYKSVMKDYIGRAQEVVASIPDEEGIKIDERSPAVKEIRDPVFIQGLIGDLSQIQNLKLIYKIAFHTVYFTNPSFDSMKIVLEICERIVKEERWGALDAFAKKGLLGNIDVSNLIKILSKVKGSAAAPIKVIKAIQDVIDEILSE